MEVLAHIEFEKYDSYKESRLNWVQQIPSTWNVGNLGSILKPISIKGHAKEQLLSITREKGVIVRNIEDETENHNFIPDDLSGYKLIKKGQFGMNKMKAWQGSYAVSQYTGIVSPAYYIFDFASNINPDFFHYAIRSKRYVGFFGQASDGVRIGQWDLSKDRMKKIVLLIPPATDQISIVNFLDTKIDKIDQAIVQKAELIQLLKERKQIIIQNVVTRGVDSNAKMKDSGVKWMGEIPEHWEVERSQWLFEQRKERARPADEQLTCSQKFGVIPQQEYMRIEQRRVTQVELNKEIQKHVEMGDFMISMRSFQGGIEFSKHQGCISSAYVPLIPNSKVNEKYYKYLFKCQRYIEALQSTSNLVRDGQALRFENFKKVPLLVIPLDEQERIASFIDVSTEKISNSISLQEKQIKKLKEYKSILIDNVVTGKVKVC